MKRTGLQASLALGFIHSASLGKGLVVMGLWGLCLATQLSGCGQRGPLYLPPPAASTQAAPPAIPAASAPLPPTQP